MYIWEYIVGAASHLNQLCVFHVRITLHVSHPMFSVIHSTCQKLHVLCMYMYTYVYAACTLLLQYNYLKDSDLLHTGQAQYIQLREDCLDLFRSGADQGKNIIYHRVPLHPSTAHRIISHCRHKNLPSCV